MTCTCKSHKKYTPSALHIVCPLSNWPNPKPYSSHCLLLQEVASTVSLSVNPGSVVDHHASWELPCKRGLGCLVAAPRSMVDHHASWVVAAPSDL